MRTLRPSLSFYLSSKRSLTIGEPGNAGRCLDVVIDVTNANKPRLTVPSVAPPRVEPKLLIAFVAWISGGDGFEPLARRDVETMLRRASGRRVSEGLAHLGHEHWLEPLYPGDRSLAYRYRLGRKIPRNEIATWVKLGNELYGPRGVLGHFLCRPAVKHGYLGLTCFVVFGLLLQAEDPLRGRDLAIAADGLLHSNTIRNCLDRLQNRAGIITSLDPAVVAADWPDLLDTYERDCGLADWAVEQDARVAHERKEFHGLRRQVDEVYDAAVVWMRDGWRCATCGEPADSVDHFPLLDWGGLNDARLISPSCLSCNSRHGARAARFKVDARLDTVLVVPAGTEEIDVERMAEAGVDIARHLYTVGEYERAAEFIRNDFGLWRHVFRGEPTAAVYELAQGDELAEAVRAPRDSANAPSRLSESERPASRLRGRFLGRTRCGAELS